MPEGPTPDASSLPPTNAPELPASARRKGLTPEQRRFLGTPRVRDEEPSPAQEEREAGEPRPTAAGRTDTPESEPAENDAVASEESIPVEEEDEPEASNESAARTSTGLLRPDQKASRASEMQRALLILGALFLLFLMFYVGKKFDYWKYRLFASRNQPKLEAIPDKFPGLSADELVAQALAAERAGKMNEAVERFVAAKHKNLRYRGILFRLGKLGYDGGEFAAADKFFERAIAFGENLDVANYYRGLIAVRRKDLAAAQRFFQAAAEAAPFIADHHYFLAEAMRMDHRPSEAIPRYENAALLARTQQDETVCRFKIRLARLEAADASRIAEEIEAKRQAGPLSVDWLMTAAALSIRRGQVDEAIPLIAQARAAQMPGLFTSCATDFYFVDAVKKHPQLAEVCRTN